MKNQLRIFIKEYRFVVMFILILDHLIFKAVSSKAWIDSINSLGLLFIIIYAIYIMGQQRSSRLWMLTLVTGIVGIGSTLVNQLWPMTTLYYLIPLFTAIFHLVMVYACLTFTLMDKKITITTLFGSLCAYLFIGEFFGSVYIYIYQLTPESFHGLSGDPVHFTDNLIYFSFVTLTTVGYGDITAMTGLTRVLAWIEAYTGQAYMTILMAFLVGRYLKQH